jgi:hypothetical protein
MRGHVEVRIELDAFGDRMVHALLHKAVVARSVLHVLHVMRRFRRFFLFILTRKGSPPESNHNARHEQADAKYFSRSHRRTPRHISLGRNSIITLLMRGVSGLVFVRVKAQIYLRSFRLAANALELMIVPAVGV